MRPSFATLVCLVLLALAAPPPQGASAQPLRLVLPTSNDALLYGDGPSFYQYTDRYFRGVRSRPWEGGRYGFVRNAVETGGDVVYTRFHEGVDIQPLYRDRNGEPLDTVRAVDEGYVVYVNDDAGDSSYGRYVVVEHVWSGSPFYSLYAHLGRVDVKAGEAVGAGARLGRVGYTGRGINRRRAHVHFEINMLLSRDFDGWHDAHLRRSRNHHGVFNGLNLAGLDVAALYLALQEDPDLTIEAFFERQQPFFSVVVPNDGILDVQHRYPWLTADYDPEAPSLDVAFTRDGLPIRVASSEWRTSEPTVAMAEPSRARYDLVTRHLDGAGATPRLSGSGERYLDLLTRAPHPPELAETLFAPPPSPLPVVESISLETHPAESIDTTAVDPSVRTTEAPPPIVEETVPVRRVRGW